MKTKRTRIGGIPALWYGEPAERLFIYVHGRHSSKEEAETFAQAVIPKGYQVLAFDLPEHGEREHEPYPCTVQNGVHDLRTIYAAVKDGYRTLCLFANSLGAYFSLLAYADTDFAVCLFLSPVLNMERLISNMMKWSNVTIDRLQKEKRIETSLGETLSWDYYRYVRQHPITKWNSPTSILYGENDHLTERDVLDSFAQSFNCQVEIMKGGEHFFHTPAQVEFLTGWIHSRKYP